MLSVVKKHPVIIAVTIGGFLEWYEMFLFGYWVPIFALQFFAKQPHHIALISSLLLFAVGFLSRPIGGVLFGYIGDRFGRKKSFLLSIVAISIPSFAIAIIPPPGTWGIFSIFLLAFFRCLQGIPAGGELPGAICYLREMAPPSRKKFLTSFAFVGPQIGAAVGMAESLILGQFFSVDWLIEFGWRLSFFFGGCIGILGFYWRKKLKESPEFISLRESHRVLKNPILTSVKTQKKHLFLGICICVLEIVGYFLVAIFPAVYFEEILTRNTSLNLLISIIWLLFSAVTIPFFGKWAEKRSTKKILSWSGLGILFLSVLLYISIHHRSMQYSGILLILFMPLLNFQFALIPSVLADLFPSNIRYSGLGIAFNVSDSILGGFTPLLAFLLTSSLNDPAGCILLLIAASVISLIAFQFLEESAGVTT